MIVIYYTPLAPPRSPPHPQSGSYFQELSICLYNKDKLIKYLYTDPTNICPLYICLFIPNECSYFFQLLCFNNGDHLAMLCTKQKSIWWSLAPITRPQAQVPEFRKSQNQFLMCLPQYIPVSLNRHTAELWVPGVFLAVMTTGINLVT